MVRRGIFDYDFRSFFLVFAAFVGNAQISGIDVVLFAFLPIAFILQLRGPWLMRRRQMLPMLMLTLLLVLAAARAPFIGINYFSSYYLWPIKALILLFLIATGRELRWPIGNIVILAIFCLFLIFVGQMQDGRLVSVFGPNMLYRIFGLLLFFSSMLFFSEQGGYRVLVLSFAFFALFAAALTGSSGALLVIAVVALVIVIRISYVLGIILLGIGTFWSVSSGILSGSITASSGDPMIYTRLLYKMASLQTNQRLTAWFEILRSPPSLFGHSHAYFDRIWTFGLEYPHNLFIELYGFYGLIGLAISIVTIWALIGAFRRVIWGNVLALTCTVLTLGAMLSGDLSDNYGAIALAMALLLRQRAIKDGGLANRGPLPRLGQRRVAISRTNIGDAGRLVREAKGGH